MLLNYCVRTPGISWLPTFSFQFPTMKRHFVWVLILEGPVGLPRTVQLQLLQHYRLGHRLGLLLFWMTCLGNEQISIILLFLRLHPSTAFWTLLLTEGLTSRSKENSKEYEGGRCKEQPLTLGLSVPKASLPPGMRCGPSWRRQDQIHGIMISLVLHPQSLQKSTL